MKRWIIRQYRGIRIWASIRFGWPLNVKWLGAHGRYPEDQHDDVGAFRRAIAMREPKGGVVWIPSGTYDVRSWSIGELSDKNVVLRGAGASESRLTDSTPRPETG